MLRLGNLWMGGVASGALSHTRTMRHCRFHLPPQPPTPTRGNPRLQHGGAGSQRLSHTRNPRLSHTRTMRHCRFHLPPPTAAPHSNTGNSATPRRGIRLTTTVAYSKPATVAHSDHATLQIPPPTAAPPLQHGEIRDSNTGDPAHSYCRTLETRDCRTLGPCETPNPESARQHARTQAPRALYRRVRTSIFCRSRSITAWRFPSPAMATIPSRGLTLSSKSRSHHKLRLASFISSRER